MEATTQLWISPVEYAARVAMTRPTVIPRNRSQVVPPPKEDVFLPTSSSTGTRAMPGSFFDTNAVIYVFPRSRGPQAGYKQPPLTAASGSQARLAPRVSPRH